MTSFSLRYCYHQFRDTCCSHLRNAGEYLPECVESRWYQPLADPQFSPKIVSLLQRRMYLGRITLRGICNKGTDYRRMVHEKCVVLDYYAASRGIFLPTVRENLSFLPSGIDPLKMGPIGCHRRRY